MTGRCNLCGEDVPSHDLLGHLRVMHPDEYGDGPERWPDGEPVVIIEARDVSDTEGWA